MKLNETKYKNFCEKFVQILNKTNIFLKLNVYYNNILFLLYIIIMISS